MNRPERRSPIRRVGVRSQDRAGSETGAPIARFMGGGQVTKEQGTFHAPGNADGAVRARFVPNRSADIGTGAEPTQTRGLAERCELGQLAPRHQGRSMAREQVQKEQGTFHEPPGAPAS
jgi:hypothetical protein